ncbi:hypothetical protein WMW72_08775 [Paenibacillus filicis]|uniref:Lipoprotein n=1 Tax=Paenibacillus filicis TaxID=669464 RepID=A0ABU9DIK0_9BACL
MNTTFQKTMTAGLAAVLLAAMLTGCGSAPAADQGKTEAPAQAPAGGAAAPEAKTPPKEEEAPSKGLDILQSKGLGQMDQIDWENVHISKKDFKKLITEMSKPKEGEKSSLIQSVSMPDDTTIEIVLDTDGQGGALASSMAVMLFDPLLRTFYVHSDFYKKDKQPVIRFKDPAGTVIAENSDFPNKDKAAK